MAQRRMFSKSITNSSQFLMMPQSSQNLYFHLGMNADDDGFCEHFSIMRMTDSKPDDLRVLHAKQFVSIFDDKVLVVIDWKENNYLRSDRYTPSKYLEIYKNELALLSQKNTDGNQMDTVGIPNGNQMATQVRIGKGRKGKVSKDILIIPDGIKEPSEEKEYGNKDINWLLEEFEKRMEFKSASSKDRIFSKHLLNNFNKEQLQAMLIYCSSNEFAPRIGSIEKMWFKRGDIVAGIKQLQNQKNVNLPKAIRI